MTTDPAGAGGKADDERVGPLDSFDRADAARDRARRRAGVEVPIGLVSVESAAWDGRHVQLRLRGRRAGSGAVRVDGVDRPVTVRSGQVVALTL